MRRRLLTAALVTVALALPLLAPAAPAATLLVANKSDDTVDLIDLDAGKSGRSRATLPTGNAPHEIAVSPSGRFAAVSNYGGRQKPGSSLTVIEVQSAQVIRTVELGEHTRPHGLAWFGDRELAVTTEGSGHLLVVDPILGGGILKAIPTGQEVSHMVVVTADGARAFVSNIGSGSVTVIDLAAGRKLKDVPTGAGAEGIALRPGSGEVWVSNREADTLSILDAETLEVVATLTCPAFPIRLEFTPDGKRLLASAARSGEVAVFGAPRRRELLRQKLDLTTVPGAARRLFGDAFGESPVPVGIEIAPDGATAWVAATQADAVVVIDVETLAVTGLIKAGREPDGMAYSPLGARAAEATEGAAH